MKHITLSVLLLTAAAASPLLAANARAAESESAAAASSEETGHPKLQEIARELALTEEQKASIQPILEKEIADLRALFADSSLRRMQKLRRAREITDGASKQVRAQLDPGQQKKYDVLRAEWQKQRRERLKERAAQQQQR